MLAPTRELVAELNHRARTHRLDHSSRQQPGREVTLADGNRASSVGIWSLPGSNDRRLRDDRRPTG